jgi:hypothetical protein
MKTKDALNAAKKYVPLDMRWACVKSDARPVTTSKRKKKKKPNEIAMPPEGYPAMCVDGPMKGMATRVKNPSANVVAPMVNDPFYYAAIYKVSHNITPLGEIACVFSHLLKRDEK